MWDWCDKLKLNTSSCAFVKREIRSLPQTEAEFEADFSNFAPCHFDYRMEHDADWKLAEWHLAKHDESP
jgi:hypothetical protein